MKSLAVIHVPNQEVALAALNGQPLMAHSVRYAAQNPVVDEVWVRSEHPDVVDVAKHHGAIGTLSGRQLPEHSIRIELDASYPLRPADLLGSALAKLRTESLGSVVTAVRPTGALWNDHCATPASAWEWQEIPSLRVIASKSGSTGFIELSALDAVPLRNHTQLHDLSAIAKLRGVRFDPPALHNIELVAFDFDGVMTDDTVIVREDGTESVIANRGDGMGLLRLTQTGVRAVVISKETNVVVAARCRKLGIRCHHGVDDKLTLLKQLADQEAVPRERIAFVGNDVNDVACIDWSACGIAVSNSRPEALAVANWVTQASGGRGAVREICEAIIAAKKDRDPA